MVRVRWHRKRERLLKKTKSLACACKKGLIFWKAKKEEEEGEKRRRAALITCVGPKGKRGERGRRKKCSKRSSIDQPPYFL